MKIIISLFIVLLISSSSFGQEMVLDGDVISHKTIKELINHVNESKKFQQETFFGGNNTQPANSILKYTNPSKSSKSNNTQDNEFYTQNITTGVFTVNKKGRFDLSYSGRNVGNHQILIIVLNGVDILVESSLPSGDNWGSASLKLILNEGDTFYFENRSNTSLTPYINILATGGY